MILLGKKALSRTGLWGSIPLDQLPALYLSPTHALQLLTASL